MVRASDTNGIVIITEGSRSLRCLRYRRRCCRRCWRGSCKDRRRAAERLIDRDGRTVLDTGELLAVGKSRSMRRPVR